jgi:hypothetical protein
MAATKRQNPIARATARDYPQESTGDAAMDSTLAQEATRRTRAKSMYGPYGAATASKPPGPKGKKKGIIQSIKDAMGIKY